MQRKTHSTCTAHCRQSLSCTANIRIPKKVLVDEQLNKYSTECGQFDLYCSFVERRASPTRSLNTRRRDLMTGGARHVTDQWTLRGRYSVAAHKHESVGANVPGSATYVDRCGSHADVGNCSTVAEPCCRLD